MDKQQFLAALRGRLAGLPEADVTSSLEYYAEMIDERIEDGVPEYEAVAAVGSVDAIAEQILLDTPLPKLVKVRVKRRRSAGGLVLLLLGSPIWLPLLLALAAVVLSVYIIIWAVIAVLYAVVLALAAAAVAALIGLFFLSPGGWAYTLVVIGAALVLAGLSILLFFAFTALAKALVRLSRAVWRGIKRCFVGKKEEIRNE